MRIVIVLCLLIAVTLLANGPEGPLPQHGTEACKIASQHISSWFVPVCKF
jgi:acid phosphatase class B